MARFVNLAVKYVNLLLVSLIAEKRQDPAEIKGRVS